MPAAGNGSYSYDATYYCSGGWGVVRFENVNTDSATTLSFVLYDDAGFVVDDYSFPNSTVDGAVDFDHLLNKRYTWKVIKNTSTVVSQGGMTDAFDCGDHSLASNYQIRSGNRWIDPCKEEVRFYKDGVWRRFGDGSSYMHNGVWHTIRCKMEYPTIQFNYAAIVIGGNWHVWIGLASAANLHNDITISGTLNHDGGSVPFTTTVIAMTSDSTTDALATSTSPTHTLTGVVITPNSGDLVTDADGTVYEIKYVNATL